MSDATRPLRLVQWTTGKISREAVNGILERPDLEIVGVYAYSAEKVGKDLGELCGLGRTFGVNATNDIQQILALAPDCVLYMPLHPDIDHLETLLRAGINVASTASFMTGRAYGEQARARLEAAALAGGASLFGSGVNPGYVDQMLAVASNVSRHATYIRILESADIGTWAVDANQDELGWGRPPGDNEHAADIERATAPFGDAVQALAAMMRARVDDIRCDVHFAYATKDLDVPGRDVRAGTVAGIEARWIGKVDGIDAIEATVRWIVSTDIEPAWDIPMAHVLEVKGHPNVTARIEMIPDLTSTDRDELTSIGWAVTAMPVVNAVPHVVAARPGIVGYQDLPTFGTRIIPKA